jgi:hypothetical protein
MSVIFKSIGVFATAVGSSIICTESFIFNNINHINPVYNTLKLIDPSFHPSNPPPVRSMEAPRRARMVTAVTSPVVDTYADTLLASEEHLNRLLSLLQVQSTTTTTTPPRRILPLIIPPRSKSQVQNRVLLRALPLIIPPLFNPCTMLFSMLHHTSSLTR